MRRLSQKNSGQPIAANGEVILVFVTNLSWKMITVICVFSLNLN